MPRREQSADHHRLQTQDYLRRILSLISSRKPSSTKRPGLLHEHQHGQTWARRVDLCYHFAGSGCCFRSDISSFDEVSFQIHDDWVAIRTASNQEDGYNIPRTIRFRYQVRFRQEAKSALRKGNEETNRCKSSSSNVHCNIATGAGLQTSASGGD